MQARAAWRLYHMASSGLFWPCAIECNTNQNGGAFAQSTRLSVVHMRQPGTDSSIAGLRVSDRRTGLFRSPVFTLWSQFLVLSHRSPALCLLLCFTSLPTSDAPCFGGRGWCGTPQLVPLPPEMIANQKGVCLSQDSVSDWKDAVAVVVPVGVSRHMF